MMKRKQTIFGAILALCITLALLTGTIWTFATSAALYEQEMLKYAPAESTGLPEAEYSAMAAHIADYLAGRKDSFQYVITGTNGESVACFHDYELIHMADCRGLIQLDGIVFLSCVVIAAFVLFMLFRWRREGLQDAWQGVKFALWCLSMIAAGLILWAVINFDGLFITFHQIAFRNDYWLLNPRTDLLIRLMPQGMFIDMGFKGLILFLTLEAVLIGCVWVLSRRKCT